MDENPHDILIKSEFQSTAENRAGMTPTKQVIVAALIGLLGAVSAAVISSWDKLTGPVQVTNVVEAQVAYGEARFTIVDTAIHQSEDSVESQRTLALNLRNISDAQKLGEFSDALHVGRQRIQDLHRNYKIALRGGQWSTANIMRTLLNDETMSLNRKLVLLQQYFGPSSKRRFPTSKQLAKMHEAIHELKELPPYGMLKKEGSQQVCQNMMVVSMKNPDGEW